jgi:hypothetical protein
MTHMTCEGSSESSFLCGLFLGLLDPAVSIEHVFGEDIAVAQG